MNIHGLKKHRREAKFVIEELYQQIEKERKKHPREQDRELISVNRKKIREFHEGILNLNKNIKILKGKVKPIKR